MHAASTSAHCPQQHVQFKHSSLPLFSMPTTATLDLSPSSAFTKSGTLPSVSTSVTSLSTRTGVDSFLDDYELLAMFQGTPLQDPPGPRLTRAITRASTKVQLAAKWKAAKDVKAKEVAEKKLASAAKKADKQQQLIVNAKARATKAAAKAKDLCLKLARAMALQDVCFTLTRRARICQEHHRSF
jgi:hypothetical protein